MSYLFEKPQAWPDLNDDDDDNNDDDDNDANANNDINSDISNDNKEEEDEIFFSKVSNVIPFWNHKLDLI